MTDKLYYSDQYARECEAVVTKVDGTKLFLDRTIFYPEGGGAPGDTGYFDGIRIVDTKKDSDDVVHVLEKPADAISVGKRGSLSLDWERRYHYMVMHTAQHLISALLFSTFGVHTVAIHLGEKYLTIESLEDIEEEKLFDIMDEANEKVLSALSVYRMEMDRSSALSMHMRRSIKVEGDDVMVAVISGVDEVPCGGVHVKSTNEIGHVTYIGKEHIRGHLRTYWRVGDEDRKALRTGEKVLSLLSKSLSSTVEGLPDALDKKLARLSLLEGEVKALGEKGAFLEASLIKEGEVFHRTTFPSDKVASSLIDRGISGIFLLDDDSSFTFLGSGEEFSKLKAKGVKGGGRNGVYRGKCTLSEEEVKEALS